ncbi:dihydrolipoamide acetyltransferase family protein [Haloglycomyces albus]|uniref:dihydrolipoamide acetyltransferase family protein n=1 Tax=Haloglycomyces albus TaxID=526067 RepID=UPI00046CE724|nr:dihydrolipoamide acetyltransferase family protein [Haloglycomyces albus]
MAQETIFNLPDLGEGLTEGEVVNWLIEPGDEVKLNQPFVEVETAKALVEVPSPFDGVVTTFHADEGTVLDVGAPLATFQTEGGDDSAPAAEADKGAEESSKRTPNLVGYGASEEAPKRRRRKKKGGAAAAPAPEPTPTPAPAPPAAPAPTGSPVLAKPPVRKLAKDLGVDLRTVTPTGPNGTISRDDVQSAVGSTPARGATVGAAEGDERIPIKGVRKMTAENMVQSAFTAPHVTVFYTVDVTAMMDTVKALKGHKDFADVKVTPMLLVAKAVLAAIKRNPMINAQWDEQAGEIVVKKDVNLGIAAATPRGLLVPNIKAAQYLTLHDLAAEFGTLVSTARDGKTSPEDMAGGTFSITNVGAFGVDSGTPILPPGESAILVFGAVRDQPWVHNGEIAVRKVTQLGLSFDHRLIDGEQGSKFLADVGNFLNDPGMALLAWN